MSKKSNPLKSKQKSYSRGFDISSITNIFSFSIFKQALFKYSKAVSTWVIIIITTVAFMVLGAYLPFQLIETRQGDPIVYLATVNATIAGVTSLLATVVCVFASFTGARLFKDEVEDGSFLILLSKPSSRTTIIFSKLVALFSFIVIYASIVIIGFEIMVLIFDQGSAVGDLSSIGAFQLRERILEIGAVIWGIMILFGVIFGSIATLISTRLSTATTIGIGIAVGIVIPVTTLIGLFTRADEYNRLSSDAISSFGTNTATIDGGETEASLIALNLDLAEIYNNDINMINDSVFFNFGSRNLGSNLFASIWFLDIDFQIDTITSLATDQLITNSVVESSLEQASGPSTSATRAVYDSSSPFNSLSISSNGNEIQEWLFEESNAAHEWALAAQTNLYTRLFEAYNNDAEIKAILDVDYSVEISQTSINNAGSDVNLGVVSAFGELFGVDASQITNDTSVNIDISLENNYDLILNSLTHNYEALSLEAPLFFANLDEREQRQLILSWNEEMTSSLVNALYNSNLVENRYSFSIGSTISLVNDLSDPITYLSNTYSALTFLSDNNNLNIDDYAYNSTVFDQSSEYFLSEDDATTLNTILALKDNNLIFATKESSYVTPLALLLFYGSLAFVLFTVSFFVVKKQNFK